VEANGGLPEDEIEDGRGRGKSFRERLRRRKTKEQDVFPVRKTRPGLPQGLEGREALRKKGKKETGVRRKRNPSSQGPDSVEKETGKIARHRAGQPPAGAQVGGGGKNQKQAREGSDEHPLRGSNHPPLTFEKKPGSLKGGDTSLSRRKSLSRPSNTPSKKRYEVSKKASARFPEKPTSKASLPTQRKRQTELDSKGALWGEKKGSERSPRIPPCEGEHYPGKEKTLQKKKWPRPQKTQTQPGGSRGPAEEKRKKKAWSL